MNQDELLNAIQNAVRDVVNNKTLAVRPESRLIDDLGLESIDLIDVSSELENTIGQELDFKAVAQFVSQKTSAPVDMKKMKVQDLIDYVQAQH